MQKITFSSYINNRDYEPTPTEVEVTLAEVMSSFNIEGLTLKRNRGMYKGAWEVSYEIELYETTSKLKQIAKAIAEAFTQESVVTNDQGAIDFIYGTEVIS